MKRPSKPRKPESAPTIQGKILSAPDTPGAHQAAAEFIGWLIQVTLEDERQEGNVHDADAA